ncbi:MAG: hypothetical protein C4523_09505 [Myxococcales bacterium]|nr:MAG: hypothetical protein C4523_09505 [Myxococcales bacterium]
MSELTLRLYAALNCEPMEDGYSHPAESILRAAKGEMVMEVRRLQPAGPSIFAGAIRCLGRIPEANGPAAAGLISDALKSESAQVRDAAICAAEQWGGGNMIAVLRNHHDPEPWLDDYRKGVITDLGG